MKSGLKSQQRQKIEFLENVKSGFTQQKDCGYEKSYSQSFSIALFLI